MAVGNAATSYVWQDPGGSISIHIDLDLVEQLSQAIQTNLGTGSRGREIGGLLLGRSFSGDHRAVLIDGFELTPCEHQRGDSYTLSLKERQGLAADVEHHRPGRVVGYFRSHTRPGLYLDQDDFAVITTCFAAESQVFLLVRPDASGGEAGFFFWEDGDINRRATYRSFPFNNESLRSGEYPLTERPAPARPAPRPKAKYPAWILVPAMAALFMLAAVIASKQHASARASVAPAASTAQQASSQPSAPGLALQVTKSGKDLQVQWDSKSPAIRQADLGVLMIDDGGHQTRRELNASDLAFGSTLYAPSAGRSDAGQVRFELQVFRMTQEAGSGGPQTTTSGGPVPAPVETASNAVPTPPGSDEQAKSAPVTRQATSVRVQPAPSQPLSAPRPIRPFLPPPPSAPVKHEKVADTQHSAPLQVARVQTSADEQSWETTEQNPPRPFEPPSRPAPHAETPYVPEPPATHLAQTQQAPTHVALAHFVPPHPVSEHNPPPPSLAAVVSYDPVRSGVFKRVLHGVSNLAELKMTDGFAPAIPIHQVRPEISRLPARGDSADVKVYIDESGNVSRAHIVGNYTEVAGVSLDAARRWRFSPARKHDKPVSSEMVLHFHFGA